MVALSQMAKLCVQPLRGEAKLGLIVLGQRDCQRERLMLAEAFLCRAQPLQGEATCHLMELGQHDG